MQIYSNDCHFNEKPEGRVFAHLWKDIVGEHLRELNHAAEQVRLSCKVQIDYDNIGFSCTGYSDSIGAYV